jgi:hypothetical protein
MGVPPLLDLVSYIVKGGSKPEMSRVHTKSDITSVADEHAIRDRPIMDLPGEPVCSYHSGLRVLNRELAVPAAESWSSPQPAAIGLLNMSPEPLLRGLSIGVMPDDVSPWVATSRGRREGLATAAGTGDDRLRTHSNLPCWGASPGWFTAMPGTSYDYILPAIA